MNITSIVCYRILVRCLYNLVLKTFTVRNVSSVYSSSKMHSSAAMLKWIGSYLALNVFGRKMHDKKWCEIWCKYKIANSTHLHTYHITWAMYSIDIIKKKNLNNQLSLWKVSRDKSVPFMYSSAGKENHVVKWWEKSH